MKGKKCIGLLILCITFLLSLSLFSNVSASSYHSWVNIQDVSKTNLSSEWITHNTSNAGSYFVSGATSLKTYSLAGSANLSSSVTGGYFNASGDIIIEIPDNLEGGLVCSAFTNGSIVPENVSYTITSSSVSNCYYEHTSYFNKYTIHINTYGTISSGSVSSFYFWLLSDPSSPFIELVGTPSDIPRVFISGDIDFSVSNSPELNSLSEINENIVIISQDLQDLSSQISDNTDAIIENQNQNAEDIIKSNQRCHKNLFNTSDIDVTRPNPTDLNASVSDGSIILTANGSVGAQYLGYIFGGFDSNKNYTLSFKAKKTVLGSLGGPRIAIIIYGSNNGVNWSEIIRIGNNSPVRGTVYDYSYTFKGYTFYRFYIYNNMNTPVSVGEKTEYFDIQLEQGDSAPSFTPYNEEVCKNYTQEYNDKQYEIMDNIEAQSDDIDSSADSLGDSASSATSSIIGNITSIIGALSTNASDCLISIQAGDNGALQLTNMNLCSMPTEMHTLVHTVSSIIVTLAVLWTSFNLLREFLDIYESYLRNGGINH